MIDNVKIPSFVFSPLTKGKNNDLFFKKEWERFFLNLKKKHEDSMEKIEAFCYFMGE